MTSHGQQIKCESEIEIFQPQQDEIFIIHQNEPGNVENCETDNLVTIVPSTMVDMDGNILGEVDLHLLEAFQELESNTGSNEEHHYGNDPKQQSSKRAEETYDGRNVEKRGLKKSESTTTTGTTTTTIGGSSFDNGGNNSGGLLYNSKTIGIAAPPENLQRYFRGPYAPLDRCNSSSAASNTSSTITQHYYPEGGWGYVVLATAFLCHALLCGLLLCTGIVMVAVLDKFGEDLKLECGKLYSGKEC